MSADAGIPQPGTPQPESRRFVADVLASCSIYALTDMGVQDAFIRGERDVPLADLGLDSLAAMEICVVLERATGLSLSPDRILGLALLGDLVAIVAGSHPGPADPGTGP